MSVQTYSREEIFDAVWARPLGQVASDYGITGTGLAKLCDRHCIPRPPQGHWVRAEHGKEGSRPPLPDAKPGEPSLIRILPPAPNIRSAGGLDARLAETGIELPKASLMVVGKRLSRPHSLIQRWLDEHERKRLRATRDHSDWAIMPSPWTELARRRHRILDCVFKALASVDVEAEQDDTRGLCLKRGPDRIAIACREKSRQVKVSLSERERAWAYETRTHRTELAPTGYLLFEIKEWIPGVKKEWLETDETQLEAVVPEIVKNCLLALHLDKERRLKREADAREWQREREIEKEKQQQAKREQARWDALVAHAKAWKERELVRDFLEHYESADVYLSILDKDLSAEQLRHWVHSRLNPDPQNLPN